jgi:hypothetical protein
MSVYHHANRTIKYNIVPAPFDHDLLLMQGSKYSMEMWRPFLASLIPPAPHRGRVVMLEWHDPQFGPTALVADCERFMRTLGLHSVKIVACEDAVLVARELARHHSDLVADLLVFPDLTPGGEELLTAIRAFSQTSRDP